MLEDVLLNRALGHIENGFYIDIGGYHPDRDSVTKHFYANGWRGVNVEPGAKYFPEFMRLRPDDINLQVAVSDHIGEATFYEMDQISTLEQRHAIRHRELQTGQYMVSVTTLAQLCEEHAPGEIHFLKIDVEGHEAAVVRGANFKKFRPWVLVIEAKEPNRLDLPTHGEWEHMILEGGYTFAYADILNRYYVANEHRDLLQYFTMPADDYRRANDIWRIMELEQQLRDATNQEA
jgi:FkbM family methyltransferase